MSICVADLRWFIQHLWLAYIACMDEQFGALEGLDDFGTQQPMSIRNDANDMGWFMCWDSTIAGESHTKNALLRPRLFLLARFPVPTLSSGSRQLQSRNLLEKFNYLVPTGNQDSRQLPLFARLAQKTLLNEAKIIIMRYRRKLLRNNRNTAGRNRY